MDYFRPVSVVGDIDTLGKEEKMTTIQVFICLKIVEVLGIGVLPYVIGRIWKKFGFDSHDIDIPYWIFGFSTIAVLITIVALLYLMVMLNWECSKSIAGAN